MKTPAMLMYCLLTVFAYFTMKKNIQMHKKTMHARFQHQPHMQWELLHPYQTNKHNQVVEPHKYKQSILQQSF